MPKEEMPVDQDGLQYFIEQHLKNDYYVKNNLKYLIPLICSLEHYNKRKEYMMQLMKKLGHIKK